MCVCVCVCVDSRFDLNFKVNQTCQGNEKWPNKAIDLDQFFDCELIK